MNHTKTAVSRKQVSRFMRKVIKDTGSDVPPIAFDRIVDLLHAFALTRDRQFLGQLEKVAIRSAYLFRTFEAHLCELTGEASVHEKTMEEIWALFRQGMELDYKFLLPADGSPVTPSYANEQRLVSCAELVEAVIAFKTDGDMTRLGNALNTIGWMFREQRDFDMLVSRFSPAELTG